MSDKPTRYWDAAPFIAWLKPEPWRMGGRTVIEGSKE